MTTVLHWLFYYPTQSSASVQFDFMLTLFFKPIPKSSDADTQDEDSKSLKSSDLLKRKNVYSEEASDQGEVAHLTTTKVVKTSKPRWIDSLGPSWQLLLKDEFNASYFQRVSIYLLSEQQLYWSYN
jgi:hypothetical protein